MRTDILSIIAALMMIATSCGSSGKIGRLESRQTGAELSIANEKMEEIKNDILASNRSSDTLTVRGLNGEKLFLMKSTTDSTGEVVGSENLSGVVVNARFKNIAERNGKVNVTFDIHIPKELQDPEWQLRFKPKIFIQDDTIHLDQIHITGKEYLRKQLKGYELYNEYLSGIITDSTLLRYQNLVEIFIERNIPSLAALKSDSSIVIDGAISGIYDISHREVLDYYKRRGRIQRNNLRSEKAPQAYERFVKSPKATEKIKLDTVITDPKDMIYCYNETISTRPELRKVEINIDGEIMQNGESLYKIPQGKPLTFYISSIATLMESDIHPEEDVIYEEGIKALKGRYYDRALEHLLPYRDLNTAVAYLCLEDDNPAREILEKQPDSAKRDYMLALISARKGDEKGAIQHFIDSVTKDRAMTFRANLDPEISSLVKKYNLKLEDTNQLNIN